MMVGPDAVSKEDAEKYGYGDSSIDNHKDGEDDDEAELNALYGYGVAAPSTQQKNFGEAGNYVRMPRRSSLKQPGAPRRASIQFGGEIEVRLPGQDRPVKRRSSIDFSNKVEEHTLSNEDYDPKESWLQPDEYKVIEKTNHKVVRKVEQGKAEGFNLCLRGLEGMWTASNQTNYRNQAKMMVLEEQKKQVETGEYYNPEKLAEQYQFTTIQSKLEAVERAETDEAEIEAYLRSTRRMLRRMSV